MKKWVNLLMFYFLLVFLVIAVYVLLGNKKLMPWSPLVYVMLTLPVFSSVSQFFANRLAGELQKEPRESVIPITYRTFKKGWYHLRVGDEKRIIDQLGLFTQKKRYALFQNPAIVRYARECRVSIRLTLMSVVGLFFLIALMYARMHFFG